MATSRRDYETVRAAHRMPNPADPARLASIELRPRDPNAEELALAVHRSSRSAVAVPDVSRNI